jgi:RecB family endonuclease NucS
MRLVVGRCRVDYVGRLTAHLPLATRLVMVKADGCVAVHADGGAYKPLNWMNAPNTRREEQRDDVTLWIVRNPNGETLTIRFDQILWDHEVEMGPDPGLQKDGVEAHLQELLAANCEAIAPGLRLVRREYPTEIGPVDLLCRDPEGHLVAIEIKRSGELNGIEQLSRYVDFLRRDPRLPPVRGVLVAQQVKPQARVLANDRDIDWVEVDYDALRGIEGHELRLF